MKGLEIKEKDGYKIVEYLGREIDKYVLLSMAVKSKSTEDAWDFLDAAEIFKTDSVFKSLHYAVSFLVVDREFRDNSEFYYHRLFKAVYPALSNCKIVHVANDSKNIPDAWVLENKENIPVEIKKGSFDKSALKQLKRYIKAYNCKHGIAVGVKLEVELPPNIKFVSILELEEFKKGWMSDE